MAGGPFWDSPDLWIRNADDGETIHQPVESGQDNWFHALIRNRGSTAARHFLVAFNVLPFAGVEFRFPDDYLPAVAAVAGFELAPGATTVVKAGWPADHVPPPGTHACWLASVFTRLDTPVAGRPVWEHNKLAQKNLAVVDLVPGDWFLLPVCAQPVRLRAAALNLVRRAEEDERLLGGLAVDLRVRKDNGSQV
jgi:hypothetical protein